MCRRPHGFSSLRNEEGFTLVEVLVALVLLGTLVLVVWAASFTGGRTLERISSGIHRNVELLEIDSAIRWHARRIIIPSWLAVPKSEGKRQRLSIPWLDGRQDKSLTLAAQNGALLIDDGGQPTSFPDVTEALMDVAPPVDGAGPALIVSFRCAGGTPVTVIASLGAVPFPLVGQ